MGCIYLLRCRDTSRCYVGQTAYTNPMYRIRQHVADSRKGSSFLLHVALREYGISSFDVECLQVVPNEMLNSLECYYAEQYNAYVWDGGYNMIECGTAPIAICKSDESRIGAVRKHLLKK